MNLLYLQISAQVFSLLVGIISFRQKSISTSGLIALLFISAIFIWSKEVGLLFSLFYMFASSSILTKYKKHRKQEFELVVGKTGPRDYIQALCNLGVATIGLLLNWVFPHELWIAFILGSIAAANADSWASEIGGLSNSQPFMITTFKPTTKGISGGVTLLGTSGGIAGSFFIVLSGILTLQLVSPFKGNLLALSCASFLAGIFGFILDSYLGAFFQALYKNKNSGQLSELNSPQSDLQKGVHWMNNDLVNFITTLGAGIVAGLLYWLFAAR